jgi:hypothetical protein
VLAAAAAVLALHHEKHTESQFCAYDEDPLRWLQHK